MIACVAFIFFAYVFIYVYICIYVYMCVYVSICVLVFRAFSCPYHVGRAAILNRTSVYPRNQQQ